MRRSLPPLNALKAFEAAARLLSFSKAAEELFVTQGAVSKQVQLLEGHLDQTLFERKATGIELTEAGSRYLPTIAEALEAIQSATAVLQQASVEQETVRLSVTPSFSSLWLIGQLNRFQQDCPDIQLDIEVGDRYTRKTDSDADLMVRCLPISEHVDGHLLAREKLLLVVSPELYPQPPQSIEELVSAPAIRHVTRPNIWQALINDLEGDFEGVRFSNGFQHFYMVAEAVKERLGMGLIPDFMAAPMLARGELMNPLSISLNSGYGFYLLASNYKANIRKNQQVWDWLERSFKNTD